MNQEELSIFEHEIAKVEDSQAREVFRMLLDHILYLESLVIPLGQ